MHHVELGSTALITYETVSQQIIASDGHYVTLKSRIFWEIDLNHVSKSQIPLFGQILNLFKAKLQSKSQISLAV